VRLLAMTLYPSSVARLRASANNVAWLKLVGREARQSPLSIATRT
jgi:hypothetical protein